MKPGKAPAHPGEVQTLIGVASAWKSIASPAVVRPSPDPTSSKLFVAARHDAGERPSGEPVLEGDPLLQGVDRFVLGPSQSAVY